jgi:hypothetical protein
MLQESIAHSAGGHRDSDIDNGKLTPLLRRLEQNVEEIKYQTSRKGPGAQTPVSKSMNVCISMIGQISRTLEDSITSFENKLSLARQELETINRSIEASPIMFEGKENHFETDGLEMSGGRVRIIKTRLIHRECQRTSLVLLGER